MIGGKKLITNLSKKMVTMNNDGWIPRPLFLLGVLCMFQSMIVCSSSLDVDRLIVSLKKEASETYKLLVSEKSLTNVDDTHNDGVVMAYEEFEIAYITMAIEEETKKILQSKGLTYEDLEAVGAEKNYQYKTSSRYFKSAKEPVTKKDAPINEAGKLEQHRVQAIQVQLIKERESVEIRARELEIGSEIISIKNDSTTYPQTASSHIASSRNIPCAPAIYTENWYQPISSCSPGSSSHIPCKRVVRDGFIQPSECLNLVKSLSEKGMVNLFHQGGATSLVPGPSSESRLGRENMNFIHQIQVETRKQIEVDFGIEPGSLHESGVLLSELKADPLDDDWEMNHSHVYWNAHVDKANIASYDYSALVYLNNIGEDFKGGSFAFIDRDDVDRIVEPQCGRLLMFSSGFENLHRVEKVTEGTRYVLAMWFTCSAQHSYSRYQDQKEEGKKKAKANRDIV
jgi:uncharacterized lipoprotein YehR (DUF1307 family)